MSSLLGGKNSQTTASNSSTTTTFPDWLQPSMQTQAVLANGLLGIDYTPYTGQRVAGFTGDENNAFNLTRGMVGQGQPTFQNALDIQTQIAQQGLNGPNQQSLQNYMNPYIKNVLDVQKQRSLDQYSQDKNTLMAQQGQTGAFGGSRAAIGQSNLLNNFNKNLQYNEATGLANAYNSGLGAYQQGLQTSGQAANAMTNTAIDRQAYGLQDINSLLSQGQQQRGLTQQGLDVNYQDYLTQLEYPYKQAQFYQGMINPLAELSRGQNSNSTSTTTQKSTPSLLSSAIGIGSMLMGVPGVGAGMMRMGQGLSNMGLSSMGGGMMGMGTGIGAGLSLPQIMRMTRGGYNGARGPGFISGGLVYAQPGEGELNDLMNWDGPPMEIPRPEIPELYYSNGRVSLTPTYDDLLSQLRTKPHKPTNTEEIPEIDFSDPRIIALLEKAVKPKYKQGGLVQHYDTGGQIYNDVGGGSGSSWGMPDWLMRYNSTGGLPGTMADLMENTIASDNDVTRYVKKHPVKAAAIGLLAAPEALGAAGLGLRGVGALTKGARIGAKAIKAGGMSAKAARYLGLLGLMNDGEDNAREKELQTELALENQDPEAEFQNALESMQNSSPMTGNSGLVLPVKGGFNDQGVMGVESIDPETDQAVNATLQAMGHTTEASPTNMRNEATSENTDDGWNYPLIKFGAALLQSDGNFFQALGQGADAYVNTKLSRDDRLATLAHQAIQDRIDANRAATYQAQTQLGLDKYNNPYTQQLNQLKAQQLSQKVGGTVPKDVMEQALKMTKNQFDLNPSLMNNPQAQEEAFQRNLLIVQGKLNSGLPLDNKNNDPLGLR